MTPGTFWHDAAAATGTTALDGPVVEAYVDHRASLVAWLTSRTRDPDLAEELAQDSYLRLMGAVRAGVAVHDEQAWLFHAARNLLIDHARRAGTAERHAATMRLPEWTASAETRVIARQAVAGLDAALARLDADDRTLLLAAAEGIPNQRLAARLGVSDGALRVRLHRARRRLRAQLEA